MNDGIYVFCSLPSGHDLPWEDVLATFREEEGLSIILERSLADRYQLSH